MKLPLLLAQFLYQNHKLNLPGIGSFALDPNAALPDEKEPPAIPAGISFQNKSIFQPDDDLIDYIKTHTGKMKSLAASDLESFITLGTQMLNIGKPLFLEGIGTLIKTKSGSFDFTPGVYTTTKLEDLNTERSEKKKSVFEDPREEQSQSNGLRKLIVVAAVLGGLFIIGFGGYKLYQKNMHQETENIISVPPSDTQSQAATDTAQNIINQQTDTAQAKKPEQSPAVTTVIPKPDTQSIKPAVQKGDTALYRVVIFETNEKDKAVSHFADLHLEKAKIYTRDSTSFKIVFYKHAATKDTSELKHQFTEAFNFPVRMEKIGH